MRVPCGGEAAGVLHVVIPAGGAGTRLWPLSRRDHPKFLRDLTGGGATLLQQTAARLTPVAASTTVVTGEVHEAAVRAQLPQLGAADILTEPAGRDSMAAIGLAAAVLARRHGRDTILGSFAADHVVADVDAFRAAVREAVTVAATDRLVTLGIAPTRPATGFGYIRPGAALTVAGAPHAHDVAEFVEKPDGATAARYLEEGYLWNAGMFVVRAGVLLDHLRRLRPALAAGLTAIADAWDATAPGARRAALDAHWAGLESIAIDHALAEPLAAQGRVAVVPMDVGWDDVGDIAALATHLPAVGEGPGAPRVLGDPARVHAIDAPGAIVASVPPADGAPARDVVVLGAPDLVVVDTPDALLVTTREHSQRVGEAVDLLTARGRTDLV